MAAEEFDIQRKYERRKEEERQKEKGIVEDKKRIVQKIKIYVLAASAKPVPPISPILGQHQLNTIDFCREFNRLTALMDPTLVLPVHVLKRADKTFDIILKPVTTTFLFNKDKCLVRRRLRLFFILPKQTFLSIVQLKQNLKNTVLSFSNTLKIMKTILGTIHSAHIKIK